jgi:hypothetical protein
MNYFASWQDQADHLSSFPSFVKKISVFVKSFQRFETFD